MLGFFSLASVTNPFMVPVIEAAASVHMLLQCVQFRLFSAKKASMALKISFSVVLPCMLLQNNMCSAMSSALRYLTKPTSCTIPLTSADSSNCNANEPCKLCNNLIYDVCCHDIYSATDSVIGQWDCIELICSGFV